MIIVHIFVLALFAVLGIIFAMGKGANLIAGYNTSSPEEKAKYDEKKLCKGMSKLMLAYALCWLVIASSEIFKKTSLLWAGIALFTVITIVALIYMNTGNRYKK